MAAPAEEKLDIPTTMRAVVCHKIGTIREALKIVDDCKVPSIGTKQTRVLVKVFYASLNPIDYKMITGMMGAISPKKPPFIVGRDFAGRIVAKGNDPMLGRFNVGDVVYGQCWPDDQGSFAEYCVAEGAAVDKIPSNLSPLQAAAVPLVAITSFQAMSRLQLRQGQKLLILGGATATGLAGIQIAKKHVKCAEVIVTASQSELCESLGADRVINYKNEKWYEVLKDYGVDAIYDCVGGDESWNLCQSQNVLKKRGNFLTIVGDEEHGGTLTVSKLIGSGLSITGRKIGALFGGRNYDVFVSTASKNLSDISALIEAGNLEMLVNEHSPFELDAFQDVFDRLMSHKSRGKLVVCVSDEGKDMNEKDGNENDQKNDE